MSHGPGYITLLCDSVLVVFLADVQFVARLRERRLKGHGERGARMWPDLRSYGEDTANIGGLPIEVFDGFRQQLAANRAQFYQDVASGPGCAQRALTLSTPTCWRVIRS